MSLPERIVELHVALQDADVPHAFGGALALAWCTQQARGTVDIDVNIFLGTGAADAAFAALPPGVAWTPTDVDAVRTDGQVRVWWERTPVDLFFNTTPFHEAAALRARSEPFLGRELPFLSCTDLAVFKAFFDRTRDWADLEDMGAAGTLDTVAVEVELRRHLGAGDPRIERLRNLA